MARAAHKLPVTQPGKGPRASGPGPACPVSSPLPRLLLVFERLFPASPGSFSITLAPATVRGTSEQFMEKACI